MHTPPEMLSGATPERSTATQAMMDTLKQNRLATIAQAAQTTI
jgi:hypothetical protein